jgi:uncharacterized membrane protein
MRSEHLAIKLRPLIEKQTALRAVLRAAHMPSHAVSEVARQLRETASELVAIADEADAGQAHAAGQMRGLYVTR